MGLRVRGDAISLANERRGPPSSASGGGLGLEGA
jgi:hypothetical protein